MSRSHAAASPYGRTRPLPIPGHLYRNGAGQVRRLISDTDGVATFQVVRAGSGNNRRKRAASHPPGYIGTMALNSFRTWLTHECTKNGTIIPHNLKPPKARTGHILMAFQEAVAALCVT